MLGIKLLTCVLSFSNRHDRQRDDDNYSQHGDHTADEQRNYKRIGYSELNIGLCCHRDGHTDVCSV